MLWRSIPALFVGLSLIGVAHAENTATPGISIALTKPTYEVSTELEITNYGEAEITVTMDSGCTDSQAVLYSWSLYNHYDESAGTIMSLTEDQNLHQTKVVTVSPGAIYNASFEVWCCPLDAYNCRAAVGAHAETAAGTVEVTPFLSPLMFVQSEPFDESGFKSCLRTDREVTAVVNFDAEPSRDAEDGESIVLVVQGGGIDLRLPLDPTKGAEVPLTAAEEGPVEFYVVYEPFGLESNHRTYQAQAEDCPTDMDGTPEDEPEDEDPTMEETSGGDGGCTNFPGASLPSAAILLGGLAYGLRRRR